MHFFRHAIRHATHDRSQPRSPAQRRTASGFSLLEMMIVAGLTAVAMVALLSIWKASQRSLQNVSAAVSLAKVSAAFDTYLRVHRASLINSEAGGGSRPHSVPFEALRTTALDAALPTTNSYGQTYDLKLLQPTKGDFKAMVTTKGGSAMSPDDVIEVARLAVARGAAAGYTSSLPPLGKPPGTCNGSSSDYSLGAFGDWCIMLAEFGLKPGAGHVQSANFYNKTTADDNDALQRTANPTAPERNRMSTSIDMDGNGITNTGSIVFGKNSTSIKDASGAMSFAVHGTSRLELRDTGKLELKAGTTIEAPAGEVLGIAGNWISGDAKGLTIKTASTDGTVKVTGGNSNSRAHLDVSGDIRGGGRLSVSDITAAGSIEASHSITSTGRIRTNEFIHVAGKAAAGTPCSQDGMIGFDSVARGLVQCTTGHWKSIASSQKKLTTTVVRGNLTYDFWPRSDATCPTGTTVISAGYTIDNAHHQRTSAPHAAYVIPSENTAIIYSRTNGYMAEALCLSVE